MGCLKCTIILLLVVLVSYARGKARNLSCFLPPQPAHGSYITDVPSGVTKGFDSLLVYYACDAGYELVGEGGVNCRGGMWSSEAPECVSICNVEKTSIVQWDTGKCLLPNPVSSVASDHRFIQQNACGKVVISSHIIAGGAPVEVSEVPWHAAVYTKEVTPYKQICGGTLVTATLVISAAHCFWNDHLLPASNYAVAVGKKYRPWNSKHGDEAQKSDVKEILVPPRYRGTATNFQDDIALLKLLNDFTFNSYVQPICLDFTADEEILVGSYGKVAGWGLTSEDGHPSRILKAVEMPYVPIHQCIDESPANFLSHITSDKICAGYKNGTAVCRGDSGGGLTFSSGKAQKFYLRGIVSAAPTNDHSCNVYTYAAFTFVAKHEEFISKHLNV